MNVDEHVENHKFTTYPHETKRAGERGERLTAVFGSRARFMPNAIDRSITQSPDHQIARFSTNSLLIPCSDASESLKPAIHEPFLEAHKKIPCYFPCYQGIRRARFSKLETRISKLFSYHPIRSRSAVTWAT